MCLRLFFRGYLYSSENISINMKFNVPPRAWIILTLIKQACYTTCRHYKHVHVRMNVCTSNVFSSVTNLRHSCPRQLQRRVAVQECTLSKLFSQIPRFPLPSFPNQPRISVSCSWETEGFPESPAWGCFFLHSNTLFKLMLLTESFLASFIENTSASQLGPWNLSWLNPEAQLHQHLSSTRSLPPFHRHRISSPYSYTLTITTEG